MQHGKKFFFFLFVGVAVPVTGAMAVSIRLLQRGSYEVAGALLIAAFLLMSLFALAAIAVHFLRLYQGGFTSVREARRELSRKDAELAELNRKAAIRQKILGAMSDDFAFILQVDLRTNHYETVYMNELYRNLKYPLEGEDFFLQIGRQILVTVDEEDRSHLSEALQKETILNALKTERTYSRVYRLMKDGGSVFRQIRFVMDEDAPDTLFVGTRDVDVQTRRELEHRNALERMLKKEQLFRRAILSEAAGYMEANLSTDEILGDVIDCRDGGIPRSVEIPEMKKPYSLSGFERWWSERMLLSDSGPYLKFGSCDYLISRFLAGEQSVHFVCKARSESGEERDYTQNYFMTRDETTGNIMCICVLQDLTEFQQREKKLRELEDALRMSRIRNSVSQMQPHFMYNALSSIREVVLDDPAYAEELICDFTTHLRACVRSLSSDDPIPFRKELENIQAYVRIEQMRFGRKLRVEYDIGAEDFSVLPLTVQPLVENAIRHGIYERGAAGGTVRIRTWDGGADWMICVSDDGVGFDPAKSSTKDSTALDNLLFRLDQLLQARVTIESQPGTGTNVTVCIPKEGIIRESDRSR